MPDETMRNEIAPDSLPPHPVPPVADELLSQLRKHESAPEHILQFFAYEHLPPHLQRVSLPFHLLATTIVADLPRNPERTVALRKLLEAKDAAVRAALAK